MRNRVAASLKFGVVKLCEACYVNSVGHKTMCQIDGTPCNDLIIDDDIVKQRNCNKQTGILKVLLTKKFASSRYIKTLRLNYDLG